MRRQIFRHLPLIAACLGTALLAACSDNTAADDITADTTLGNVDVQQGTISDDMITPDTLQSTMAEEVQAGDEAVSIPDGGTTGEKSENTVPQKEPPASGATDEE